jgi:hypothetical protein
VANKEEHLTWAKHNHDFWTSYNINTTPFLDWVVTGIFYETLHWVEAFLATKKHHSDTHGNRSWVIHNYAPELRPIENDYNTLKMDSENARYRCYKHTPKDVNQEIIPLLDSIRSYIEKFV